MTANTFWGRNIVGVVVDPHVFEDILIIVIYFLMLKKRCVGENL